MNTADGPTANKLPAWMRWLHTYVSMVGLGALLFFSLTGITLNHPEWTLGFQRREQRFEGRLDPAWLAAGGDEKAVDKLAVAEALRARHGLRGWVDDFRVDEAECTLAFKGPGSAADVVVQRKTGAYQVTQSIEGPLALVNDLHKGRHTGAVWAWVLDLTAGLLALVAFSGVWLLLYVRRRRASGLWIGLAGALVLWAVYAVAVR